jgi:adenylylsulfate kinase
MKILICGLPGSGKTTLASALLKLIDCVWYNADAVRKNYNDWDFSKEGRLRQATRMKTLADDSKGHVICDFVAPTKEIRDIFNADYTIWVDTIKEGRFNDTNKVFEPPTQYDMRVIEQDAERWATIIAHAISIKELNER